MGDFIYAISDGGVTATNLTTMEETASVEFAEYIVDSEADTDGANTGSGATTDSPEEPKSE